MPPSTKTTTLNQEILTSICRKLLKDEEYDAECLNQFALTGKESLEAYEGVIASAKSVYIDGETFLLKMTNGEKTYLTFKPSKVATARLLKIIGSCTKRVAFTGITDSTRPIIDAICNAKKLTKLSYFDEMIMTENENPFLRIFQECHASIKKIVAPAQFYFFNFASTILPSLQTLHFKSDEDNTLQYLNHPLCVANELIIDIREQEGNSITRWETVITSLVNCNNPALSNLKHLKLKLHIEEYIDSALSQLLQAISTKFPSLQTFTVINQLSLNEYCHTFQDFINHSTYYQPLYNEILESNYSFAIEAEWNVRYNVVEKMFKPHYTDICRRIYGIFDSEFEDRNTLILFKNDELSSTKSISFEVRVVNGE